MPDEKAENTGAGGAAGPRAASAPANVAAMPYEVYQASQALESSRQAVEFKAQSESVEGGRYQVGDQMVNAEGEPIKDDKK